MTDCERRTELRSSGLEGDNRFAEFKCLSGDRFELHGIFDRLDMQTEDAHFIAVAEDINEIFNADCRLVACRYHIGERHRALAHCEVG